jgi:hypothetical protein
MEGHLNVKLSWPYGQSFLVCSVSIQVGKIVKLYILITNDKVSSFNFWGNKRCVV